jgi:hypothetical protein
MADTANCTTVCHINNIAEVASDRRMHRAQTTPPIATAAGARGVGATRQQRRGATTTARQRHTYIAPASIGTTHKKKLRK